MQRRTWDHASTGAGALLVVLCAAGCGRLGYSQASIGATDAAGNDGAVALDGASGDGGATDLDGGTTFDAAGFDAGDASSPTDAGGTPNAGGSPDAGPLTVPTGPFGAPMILSTVSSPTADDDDPSRTGDGLELYFNSDRGGGSDIWSSARARTSDPWGAPTMVTELSSGFDDSTPQVSADGLSIWISSDRPGGLGGRDLWVSTRASRGSRWPAPTHVPDLSSTVNETGGSPDSSLTMIVVNSPRPGGTGGFDLFLATRPSATARWGTPVALDELNSTANETGGSLGVGGRLITFSSTRAGGAGGLDIYSASRTDTRSRFGAPVRRSELGSAVSDSDTWISPDGRTILFSSDRGGTEDLYVARR